MSLRKGTTTRRFERVEGSSSEFWEVEVAASELTVRFGRIGTAGQAKTKAFASQALAEKQRDALVKEKVGKGYVETSAVAQAAASGPALEVAPKAPPTSARPVPAATITQPHAAQAHAAVEECPAQAAVATTARVAPPIE